MTETVPMTEVPSDLPPRTWHGWWLARPKWLRIGCWAAVGVALLHIALAIRITVGLMESAEISQITRRGGGVGYSWDQDPLPWYMLPQPLDQADFLVAGLLGRSNGNVVAVYLSDATDTDLRLMTKCFPNVRYLKLTNAAITPEGVRSLQACRQLEDLDVYASTMDDAGVANLADLPCLSRLELNGTDVTDAALSHLKRMKTLRQVDLGYTNTTHAAIQAAQLEPNVTVWTEKSADGFRPATAVVLWSDGGISKKLFGAELDEVPRGSPKCIDCYFGWGDGRAHLSRLINTHVSQMVHWKDGEYQLVLRYGKYRSEPVVVQVTEGEPSMLHFEFQMSVTKQQALGEMP